VAGTEQPGRKVEGAARNGSHHNTHGYPRPDTHIRAYGRTYGSPYCVTHRVNDSFAHLDANGFTDNCTNFGADSSIHSAHSGTNISAHSCTYGLTYGSPYCVTHCVTHCFTHLDAYGFTDSCTHSGTDCSSH
jgi:hypothetical protein